MRYEQETVVNYNAEEQNATVYTRDKAVMKKLDMLVADFPDTYTLTGQDEVSKTYSFPKSYVSYRKPRVVSTEQRERARQMMIERNTGTKIKDFLWKHKRIYDNMRELHNSLTYLRR